MNDRTVNNATRWRVVPFSSLGTTYKTLQELVDTWLTANSKELPAGKVLQVIINSTSIFNLRDTYFKQAKAVAADTDKIIPVYNNLGGIEIASQSSTISGTIELYIGD